MTSRPRAATSLATNTALSLLLKRSSAFSRARCCMPASACTCLQSGGLILGLLPFMHHVRHPRLGKGLNFYQERKWSISAVSTPLNVKS